jgi:hypothetical protein
MCQDGKELAKIFACLGRVRESFCQVKSEKAHCGYGYDTALSYEACHTTTGFELV